MIVSVIVKKTPARQIERPKGLLSMWSAVVRLWDSGNDLVFNHKWYKYKKALKLNRIKATRNSSRPALRTPFALLRDKTWTLFDGACGNGR